MAAGVIGWEPSEAPAACTGDGGERLAAMIGDTAMNKTIRAGAALMGLLLLSGSWASAQAQDKDHGKTGGDACFYSRDISSWSPVDRSTINIRVHINDIYQLKLLGDCPNIDWVEGIGLQHRGSPWICSGLDAEILAPQPGAGGPIRCPVTSIRKLSKEEAAALPRKQHP
jgi:hypothetical protein